MIVVGIGARKDVQAQAIIALVEEVLQGSNIGRDDLACLATPDWKAQEKGIVEAGRHFGVAIQWVVVVAIARAQPFCLTRSERVAGHVGHASIAEACAIAAAGEGARLIVPRCDNGTVTCAVAETSSREEE